MTLPPFTRILARRPADNFADGLTTVDLGQPNIALAMQQYDYYLDALRDCGLDVTVLPPDDRFPDGHFVEDPIVIFRDMAFLCRSGAGSRRGEPQSLAQHLSHLRQIAIQGDDAFIDGGDVLFCADRVLIGISERTNIAGASQLRDALLTVQADLYVEFVPFSGVLHLKSGLTELAPNVLLHDPKMKLESPITFAEVIDLPADEGYAADVMPVNDSIFIPKGYPTVRTLAERYYDPVVALDMSEFQKMDGGLTCLSLRY